VKWRIGWWVSKLEDCCGSFVASCCCEKLVAEAGDSSGTQRKGNVHHWSRYQAMVSGYSNRLRTLVCVWQQFKSCSHELCVKRVQQIQLPIQTPSTVTLSRESSNLRMPICKHFKTMIIPWMSYSLYNMVGACHSRIEIHRSILEVWSSECSCKMKMVPIKIYKNHHPYVWVVYKVP
jgi:hypothetical protein